MIIISRVNLPRNCYNASFASGVRGNIRATLPRLKTSGDKPNT